MDHDKEEVDVEIVDEPDDEQERFTKMKSVLLYQKISEPRGTNNSIVNDHTYDTPSNWWAVKPLAKPVKFIFGAYETRRPEDPHPTQIVFDELTYDRIMKTRKMNETTGYRQGHPEFEEKQQKLYGGKNNFPDPLSSLEQETWDKANDYLNAYKLARLVHNGHKNELIWRKLVVRKAAKQFRSLFVNNVVRNAEVLRWLHNKLLDELDEYFLQVYVEICQYLKKKIPGTMNIILTKPTTTRLDVSKAFKDDPWDPITPQVIARSLKPLQGDPIIIIVPTLAGSSAFFKRWEPHLSGLGSLYAISFCDLKGASIVKNLDKTVAALRTKLQKFKREQPGRRLILMGFQSGAAMAIQVARKETVSAVVCVSFPLRTLAGNRGIGRDVLFNQPAPILFIMGEHATTSNVEEMEMLRRNIRVGTGLVVVNGGRTDLRMPIDTMMKEGVTQTIVDRCIVEEMVEFLEVVHLYPEKFNFVKSKKSKVKLVAGTETATATDASSKGESNGKEANKSRPSYVKLILSMNHDAKASFEAAVDSVVNADYENLSGLALKRKEEEATKLRGGRGRGRGSRGRGSRGGTARGDPGAQAEPSGETSGESGGCGKRGRRRGRPRAPFCPYAKPPTRQDSVFKRHNPFLPEKPGSTLKPDMPTGGLISPQKEMTDCDSYIDNLMEIMKLEDVMFNPTETTIEEDEYALAQLLHLDDFND